MSIITHHDDGEGFPIVWIHGFPLSAAVFEPQLSITGFRHIRPDLRGFGATPPPSGTLTMGDYARDIVDLLDSLAIRSAVIAGVSMGGYIAMELLRTAPERIAALLLMDTRETPDTAEGKEIRRRQSDEVTKSGNTGFVVDAMLPKMAQAEEDRQRLRPIMESATPQGVIAALHALASRPDSADTIRGIRIPTLVVVGDRDQITPPTDAERMTAMIPLAEMAPIAKAGHMANFEKPQQLNPLIAAFLTRYVIRHEHHV